ncbi:hypothetical protein KZX45_14555 [Georgenia sp. EYE_87]|uniref:DUF6541 family protein n=1 Tax=Georgenia sp. EYE_87 TaxID=2853448 RepID=UPI002002F7CD|nr:DUF6541 family protein [Georgenia sp. EYE_87]MCK6211768.1 hypothetical protein [Georgenia sp. EYE_87]
MVGNARVDAPRRMTMLDLLASVAVVVLLLFVPGAACLRLLGVRGILVVGAAPAASIAVIGAGTVLLDLLGVPWLWWSAGLWLVLVCGVVGLFGRLTAGSVRLAAPDRRGLAMVVGGLAVAFAVQVAAYHQGMGSLSAVPQMHDSLFHLNGVELVSRTGNASPFGGLAGMYGDGGTGYYPSAWHAVVALASAVAPIEVATGAALYVAILMPWLLGIAALGAVAVPGRPVVAAVAPVVACSFLTFPTIAAVFKGMYPFGFSVALTPGALALAVAVLQRLRESRGRGVLTAALSSAGVVLAHASGAAALALLVSPVLVQECWRLGTRLVRGRRGVPGVAVAAAPWVLGLAFVVAVYTVPRLQAMANFASPEQGRSTALVQALLSERTGEASTWVNVVMVALVSVGLAAAAARAHTRWLAFSWLLALAAYVVTAGPEGRLRVLAGFWYKSPDRVDSLLVTMSAVLGAVGLAAVGITVMKAVPRVAPRVPARAASVAAAAVVLVLLGLSFATSGGFRHDERVLWTARAYDPERMIHPPWASGSELDFVRGLRDVLPADAQVLGDPMNGAGFIPALAGRQTAVPALGDSVPTEAEDFLMQTFRNIHTDPTVCDVLDEEGIGYYYEDVSVPYGARTLADFRPGLYGVDTADGFDLLAREGTAALYRITACG